MKETTVRPGGPAGLFLRAAAVPLAAALALAGQVVLSRGGAPAMSLLPGAALLALALGLLVYVLSRRRFDDAEEPRGAKRTAAGLRDLAPGLEWTIVAILVLGGLYLRLYRIDIIPWGLNNDEAINALEIRDIQDGRTFATLTKRGLNRETLFHYLGTFAFRSGEIEVNLLRAMPAVLGLTPKFVGDPLMALIFPLRSVAIAAGTLTLLALYLFARDRFGWLVAMLATAFLAASPWHLHYSRVGERAVLTPLFAIATIGFFLRALESGRTRDHVAWGVFLGLGFWSYTSFRAVPIAMIAFAILRRPLGWGAGLGGDARARRAVLIATGLAAVLLVVLMLLSGVGPLGFLTRGTYATLIVPKANFALNLLSSGLMAHYVPQRYAVIQSDAFIGDGMSAVYGLIGLAPETTVVAALAALGIVYAAWRALRRRDAACGLVVLCFLALIFTVGLAGPSLTRMLLNDTWLCLFAALIARRLFEDVAALRPPLTAWLGALLIAPLVAWSAAQGCSNYFVRAGKSEQAMQHFGATQTIMGMFVRSLPPDRKVYVLHSLRVDSLRYLIGDRPNVSLISDPSTLDLDGIIKMPSSATFVIEYARPFAETMRYLIMRYPLGDATQIADGRFDPDKVIFYTFTLWKDESGRPVPPPDARAGKPPGGGPSPGDVPPLVPPGEAPPAGRP
jgi:dolichyl-phosphate-mannose-protein mannosyltransferase